MIPMQTHTRLLQRLPSADPIRPLTGSISAPFGSFQPSHRPANANNSPSLTSKQNGCFAATFRRHSWNPSAGTRQRRDFIGSRKAGFVAAVSDLALIMLAEPDMSFAHDGISPHRIKDSTRFGSFGCWRMTGTGLRRRDVVSRLPVVIEGSGVELLGDDLITAR